MSNASHAISKQLSPFPTTTDEFPWLERDLWPARWISVDTDPAGSFVSAFRLNFTCQETAKIPILVTADQRYQLFLDGKYIGQGPERGSLRKWFYERYEIEVEQGEHKIEALCWFLTPNQPWAQISSEPGFLLAAVDNDYLAKISTGLAPWKAKVLENVSFLGNAEQVGRETGGGARISVVGRPLREVFIENDSEWETVSVKEHGNNAFLMNTFSHSRILYPGTLPQMRRSVWKDAVIAAIRNGSDNHRPFERSEMHSSECDSWQLMLDSQEPVTVLAGESRRILIDLGNYVCGYYRLRASNADKAVMTVGWAERLSISSYKNKASDERNQIEGRFFVGTWDEFVATGAEPAIFEPLWWQSGRWVSLTVTAGEKPLVIEAFDILETGYPLDKSFLFSCDNGNFDTISAVSFRTVKSCAHETYMDCPYWEQLQYIADTRLQALITYVTGHDSRLAEKAIDSFSYSITGSSAFLSGSYPSRYVNAIAPFSLCWINMLHDFGLWRGNLEFIKKMLPCAWWILDQFLINRGSDGLLLTPKGWNYIDAAFPGQEPPGSKQGQICGLLNWQFVLAVQAVSELSQWVGETELENRAKRLASEISIASITKFWDESRHCMADDVDHIHFSQHSQCLALLSGRLPQHKHQQAFNALLNDDSLLGLLPYFENYLLEVLADNDRDDELIQRIEGWKRYIDIGFKTFPEHGVNGRSDCHAWNAHPLYHMLRGVLGIRPGGFGFEKVIIKPCMGPLNKLSGKIPHPSGEITADLQFCKGVLTGTIILPDGINGQLYWRGQPAELNSGLQSVIISE